MTVFNLQSVPQQSAATWPFKSLCDLLNMWYYEHRYCFCTKINKMN